MVSYNLRLQVSFNEWTKEWICGWRRKGVQTGRRHFILFYNQHQNHQVAGEDQVERRTPFIALHVQVENKGQREGEKRVVLMLLSEAADMKCKQNVYQSHKFPSNLDIKVSGSEKELGDSHAMFPISFKIVLRCDFNHIETIHCAMF